MFCRSFKNSVRGNHELTVLTLHSLNYISVNIQRHPYPLEIQALLLLPVMGSWFASRDYGYV